MTARSALLPIVGAIALVVLSAAGAVIFVGWRQDAEHRVLAARAEACRGGDARACDGLRSACLKRSAEACDLLADAYLAAKNPDAREAARLFGEACSCRGAEGCFRGGTLFASGQGVPRDLAHAKDLFERGCYLGDSASCSARKQLGNYSGAHLN